MIFEKLKAIVVDKLSVDENEVTMEATFEDLGADSLDIVEIVMALEEEFDIEISDDEAEQAKTVGDVVNYLVTVVGED
ncbi:MULTISPECIES: acyl carrier protein [Proteiniclasticum]|jgi:acyl carrier protein|uniref:Acyl carrier protein n=1 Tax=Proteiniclasticum ruminis TaxID=398199 RepID=A0A1G8G3N7_9CLOT|nr:MULTISPECIES: acyl carrier protein [Proteiniclasticum]SDH89063.1 acyl carrier protein [Proteiniclasticum ruminis]HBW12463.1 acyl carrier protein [Proteiniclasticum sp.]